MIEIIIFGAVVIFGAGGFVMALRALSKKHDEDQRRNDERLRNHDARLEIHDKAFTSLSEGQRYIQLALDRIEGKTDKIGDSTDEIKERVITLEVKMECEEDL